MKENQSPSSAPVTNAFKQWLKRQEWDAQLENYNDESVLEINTFIDINNRPHFLSLGACDDEAWFALTLYGYTLIPLDKIGRIARLLNRINAQLPYGRLACPDDGEENPVNYEAKLTVKGTVASIDQIENIVHSSFSAFEKYGTIIDEIICKNDPIDKIWSSFQKRQWKI